MGDYIQEFVKNEKTREEYDDEDDYEEIIFHRARVFRNGLTFTKIETIEPEDLLFQVLKKLKIKQLIAKMIKSPLYDYIREFI